jgi:soluble lytic murein transglycosylase
MKLQATIKGIMVVSVFIIISFAAALHVVQAADEGDNQKELIVTKTFEFLKNRKAKGTDEKLMTIANSVYEESQRYDIDYRLILAVMKVESNFKNDAISRKGARGLLQVKPSLARHISKTSDISIKGTRCLHEPEKNIKIGVYYLSRLLDRFEDLYTALHAYNVGPRKVKHNASSDEMPKDRFTKKVIKEYQQITDILPEPEVE